LFGIDIGVCMEKSKMQQYVLPVIGAIMLLSLGYASYFLFTNPLPAQATSTVFTSVTTSIPPSGNAFAVGESFNVTAYSNPSTGYSWNVSVDNPSIVSYVGNLGCAVPPPAGLVGAGCNDTFGFKALSVGATEIRMRYLRPWEANSTVQTMNVSVTVAP